MFDKTSSLAFQDYGTTVKKLPRSLTTSYFTSPEVIQRRHVDKVYYCDKDVYVTADQGSIAALVIYDGNTVRKFVIHRITKIKKGMWFNVCAIAPNASVITYVHKDSKVVSKFLDQRYYIAPVRPSFSINEIFAYYYEIRNPEYVFKGEKHPYWELTFVDNGCFNVTVDNNTFDLKTYDCLFFAPNQFHKECNNSNEACSYVTVMFDATGLDESLFKNRIFHLNNEQYGALSLMVRYTSLNDIYAKNDLIVSALERFISLLIVDNEHIEYENTRMPVRQKSDDPLLNEMINYINSNIFKTLSIDDLCHQFSMSRSSLQSLFHTNFNMAPKQYINEVKLNRACLMIREGKYNISEISSALGFASIHYFSRKFKQYYKVSPSEYVKKIYKY